MLQVGATGIDRERERDRQSELVLFIRVLQKVVIIRMAFSAYLWFYSPLLGFGRFFSFSIFLYSR
jgi:hypothetical protein